MTYTNKHSNRKVYLSIVAIAILVIAGFVAIYATNQPQPRPLHAEVGVRAGDTFTYSIIGTSEFAEAGIEDTPGFDQYNQTDHYKITITDVDGPIVSMDAAWRFLNGTQINYSQTIDVTNGNKGDADGFWAIYPANLTVSDLLRPFGGDGTKVNATSVSTYADSKRETNFWFINNGFYDTSDPSLETLMYDYRNIYFDKITGMLTSYDEYQVFNNPQMQEVISWRLISTSVWRV